MVKTPKKPENGQDDQDDQGGSYYYAAGERDGEPELEMVSEGDFWQIGRYYPDERDNLNNDIWFGVRAAGAPKEQQELKARIERTLSSLRSIYTVEGVGARQAKRNRANFDIAYEKLLSLATVGLSTATPDPQVAGAALDALQLEIVDREAGRVKNTYMVRLGIPAFFAALFFAVLFFAYQYVGKAASWPEEVYKYRYVFLVLTGCMAGTWASFAARKVVLGFLDLAVLEQDRLDPSMRLIFTGLLTVFLTLIIITGMVDIVVGGFHASTLVQSGTVALLVGAFAGLTEQTLPAAIMDRATSFTQAISRKTD